MATENHKHDHIHQHDRTTAHGEAKQYYFEGVLSRRRMAHVKQFIKPGSVVCDVGCGYQGNFLLAIQDRLAHGYGFDISVDTKMNTPTITLQAADINQHIPLLDNTVDVVTSLAVLEHLADRTTHLREIYRILKPGGQLLLTTPTPRNQAVLEFLAFRLHVIDDIEIADHKCYLSGNDLRQALKAAGFQNENIITSTWQFGLNNSVRAKK